MTAAADGADCYLRSWAGWAPGLEDAAAWRRWAATGEALQEAGEAPKLEFMAPLLRRRASALTRAALWSLYQVTGADYRGPVVFASRHGELARSAGLLAELARNQPLSPNAFSLSVHNTALGLFAIATGNQAPASALAAGADSLAMGLLEALGYLQQGAPEVALVVADEQVPAFYADWVGAEPPLVSLALRLAATGPGEQLRCLRLPNPAAEPDPAPVSAMLRFLAGNADTLRLGGEQSDWIWRRCGQG